MTRRAGKGVGKGKRGRSYDLLFPENTQEKRVLKPQKLVADKTYFICSEDGSVAAESRTGADLMNKGIPLTLAPRGSEIIYLSTTRKTVPGSYHPAPPDVNRQDK